MAIDTVTSPIRPVPVRSQGERKRRPKKLPVKKPAPPKPEGRIDELA